MLSRIFIKRGGRIRLSSQATSLLRLSELDVNTASCRLRQTADGEEAHEDLGTAQFFKNNGQLMIRDRTFFITTPDGIKAENRDHFQGGGEIINLWFIHDRVPRIIECRVEERVRFTADTLRDVDPKVGVGYRLTPLTDVIKHDKRSSLRFTHLPGRGSLPVYPQILFDIHVWKTDAGYPTEGATPLWLEELRPIPVQNPDDDGGSDLNLESLVNTFKEGMRANPTEDRQVHVSKPYLDEKLSRSVLLELGYSDVLGLGSEEIGRNLHIKKPMVARTKDRRDPNYIPVGSTLVLHYGLRSSYDGQYNYYELVTELSKGGLENITLRPQTEARRERGLRMPLVDFSVNGMRFDVTPQFMEYVVGPNYERLPLDRQIEILHHTVLLFHFYPRLRFSKDTDVYRPSLPKKIAVLGRIVRSEAEWENEQERLGGRLKSFGVKFMYHPLEYSRDLHFYDRWELIRPFKENRYFKEVHKSLNGLIAFLESQTKE